MLLSLPWETVAGTCPKPNLPLINIGYVEDLTICELAEAIADAAGFTGTIEWDHSEPNGTPQKLMKYFLPPRQQRIHAHTVASPAFSPCATSRHACPIA